MGGFPHDFGLKIVAVMLSIILKQPVLPLTPKHTAPNSFAGFMAYNDVHKYCGWLHGPSRAIVTMSAVKLRENANTEMLFDVESQTLFDKYS